jgi:hypothetical protein
MGLPTAPVMEARAFSALLLALLTVRFVMSGVFVVNRRYTEGAARGGGSLIA